MEQNSSTRTGVLVAIVTAGLLATSHLTMFFAGQHIVAGRSAAQILSLQTLVDSTVDQTEQLQTLISSTERELKAMRQPQVHRKPPASAKVGFGGPITVIIPQ